MPSAFFLYLLINNISTFLPRRIPQHQLEVLNVQQTGVHYPALQKPLSLITRFLRSGDVLEDLTLTGPVLTRPFSVTIPQTAGWTGKTPGIPTAVSAETVLPYTNGSKLEN